MEVKKSVIEKLMARVKTRWVQWVIGAVVGALAAAGVITVTGCTVSVDPEVVRYIIQNPIDNSGK